MVRVNRVRVNRVRVNRVRVNKVRVNRVRVNKVRVNRVRVNRVSRIIGQAWHMRAWLCLNTCPRERERQSLCVRERERVMLHTPAPSRTCSLCVPSCR